MTDKPRLPNRKRYAAVAFGVAVLLSGIGGFPDPEDITTNPQELVANPEKLVSNIEAFVPFNGVRVAAAHPARCFRGHCRHTPHAPTTRRPATTRWRPGTTRPPTTRRPTTRPPTTRRTGCYSIQTCSTATTRRPTTRPPQTRPPTTREPFTYTPLSGLPAVSLSSASDARLDAHQHEEHSRAPGRFTGSPQCRHWPNGGPIHGWNRFLIMEASRTIR